MVSTQWDTGRAYNEQISQVSNRVSDATCYLSFIEIGLAVPEKNILSLLPHMGMAAIMVMRPGLFI